MFKFYTIGAFDNAINLPVCVIPESVTVPVVNGMGVTVNRETEELALTTADTGRGDVYVVYSEHQPLYCNNKEGFVPGDKPLVYRLASITGYEVEVSMDDALFDSTKSTVAVGKLLGYGADGKLGVISSANGYAVWLHVVEIKGTILRAEVVTSLPVGA